MDLQIAEAAGEVDVLDPIDLLIAEQHDLELQHGAADLGDQ